MSIVAMSGIWPVLRSITSDSSAPVTAAGTAEAATYQASRPSLVAIAPRRSPARSSCTMSFAK